MPVIAWDVSPLISLARGLRPGRAGRFGRGTVAEGPGSPVEVSAGFT
jgi:hypothetical protein